jgi:protein-S-isoprenylcysteine O-methyltransferase Ste14
MRVPLAALMSQAGVVTWRNLHVHVTTCAPSKGFGFYSGLFSQVAVLSYIALVVVLTLARRRPLVKLRGLAPRAAALAASCLLPIALGALQKPRPAPAREALGAVLILAGMTVAVWTLGWLGRSFSVMPEARRLVTGGPYRWVRHPLYLGEAVQSLGVLALFPSLVVLFLVAAQLALQAWRIRFEERALREGFPEEFDRFAARTRARLLPGIW